MAQKLASCLQQRSTGEAEEGSLKRIEPQFEAGERERRIVSLDAAGSCYDQRFVEFDCFAARGFGGTLCHTAVYCADVVRLRLAERPPRFVSECEVMDLFVTDGCIRGLFEKPLALLNDGAENSGGPCSRRAAWRNSRVGV